MRIRDTDATQHQPSEDLRGRAWRLFDSAAADWLLGLIGPVDLIGCAVAALAVGCDSRGLASIAALREDDRGAILTGLYGAFDERGIEFPLKDDALKLSADGVLARMVSGAISAEQASVRLWSVADRDADGALPELQELRDRAISLSLHDDPDCGFDLDVDDWRSEMLAFARAIVARGGVGAGGQFESEGDGDGA